MERPNGGSPLLLAAALLGAGCIIQVHDDDDGHHHAGDGEDPEVDSVHAACDSRGERWRIEAEVSDPDGTSDLALVTAEVYEVYPDDGDQWIGSVSLARDGDGLWTAEVDSSYGFLDCGFQYVYCFDVWATDHDGGRGVGTYCTPPPDDTPNAAPEVARAEAFCDPGLTAWTLEAEVVDADGAEDVTGVGVEVFEVFPDRTEDYVGHVDLEDAGGGLWDAALESDFAFLDCGFQYTYCFDFRATDAAGAESDVAVVCN